MPSYSQYKRQMAVMDADDANIETWITVKGNHIPIMKGQSKEEAVQSFLEKKGKSSGGAKTVMKPDVEKPGSTTVVSKGSGKAKYKVGDVTKQGKIKEVIPARLSDTPYYKLENGKTYLEEELHAEKPAFRELKGTKHQGGTIGLSKEEHNRIEEYNKWARKETRRVKSGEAAREANARPILKADENADVSDIVKQYKADMKALGENASAAKQNKVEVNAIKEFMRRKVGAGHPYEDYYNYWLRGMSKNDSDAFNSIYGESENREKAFEALSNEKDKPAKKESDKDFIKRKLGESKEKAAVAKKRTELGQAWRNGEMSDKEFAAKSNSITESKRYKENQNYANLLSDVDHYFLPSQANEKVWKRWEKIKGVNDLRNKYGDEIMGKIRSVQKTGYYTPTEILNALEDGNKFDDMLKSIKPANKGWMNARSSHPETIGKVVRRVVKKMGEARKENSWTMADGTNVSVKNGVVTFNKNGKTKSMSEKEWAKLSKNPPSGSARGIFDD